LEEQKGQYRGEVAGTPVWLPPPTGVTKVNVDAAIGRGNKRGMGVVVRDCLGESKLAACKGVHADWDVDTSEAYAVLFGLQVCKEAGFRCIELEMDSKTIAAALNKRTQTQSYASVFIQDALRLGELFDVVSFSHVRRNANRVAHRLARLALQFDGKETWNTALPQCITDVIELEKQCIPVPGAGSVG